MTQKKERIRRRSDPEYERRTEIAERAICVYLAPSKYNALSLEETLILLNNKLGNYTITRAMRLLGISQDRSGQNGKRRFRIRDPRNPRLAGVWDKPRRLQAFIVGFIEAENERKREGVLALLYEYNGLPYTPLIPLRPLRLAEPAPLPEPKPPAEIVRIQKKNGVNGARPLTKPLIPAPLAVEIPLLPLPKPEPRKPTSIHDTKTLKLKPPSANFSWKAGLAVFAAVALAAIFMVAHKAEESRISARASAGARTLIPSIPPFMPYGINNPIQIVSEKPKPETAPRVKVNLPKSDVKVSPAFTIQYAFRKNDTLWGIVRRHLGPRARKQKIWTAAEALAEHNSIRVPEWGIMSGKLDSRRIAPGTIIHLAADLL